MLGSLVASIGIRGFLMAGAVAAVSFLAWDYKSTKAENEALRLEVSAVKAAQLMAETARDVAIAEAQRQDGLQAEVKTRTIVIRKRPDGNETASDILLDTVRSLHGNGGEVQASAD